MKAIVNAKVVLERGIIFGGTVLIDGEFIVAVGASADISIPDDCEIIDAEGNYVGPGFVDIHVHAGGGAHTALDPETACRHFLSHGETTVLATPSYDMDLEELIEALKTARDAMEVVPNLRGIYCEGPYTNPKYGSHSYENPWRKPIAEEEFKAIVDAGGDAVRVWTVAPEREGLLPFLAYAREVNPDVVFSVGHSEATPAEIRALGRFRPSILTHAMNATGRLPVPDGTRGYGPDEYALKETDVYCELISDSQCIHVNSELQELIISVKGLDRVILITDSTEHDEPNPPHLLHVSDLNFDAHGGIAGSKLTMDAACKNIMTHTNIGIAQAFKIASTTPARAVGLGDLVGSIECGKRADIVIVDDVFNVKKVILGGETV